MSQRKKPWYKRGWVIFILIIFSFLLMGTVSLSLLFYENYKKIKSGELDVFGDNIIVERADTELIKKIEGWEKFKSHKESRHCMAVDAHRQYLIYSGKRILEAWD